MPYTIHQHLAYTVWANEKLSAKLHTLDEKLLKTELVGSFPSIEKTLLHMWNAELIWLSRLKGSNPSVWPLTDFSGGKTELLNGLVQSSKDVLAFIESSGPAFLQSKIQYKTIKGDSFENEVEELLFHLVNHGTYHRGQITTMLRQLGITDPPSTDIIFYLRAIKK
ncbi:MAG: DinB family protein [Cyclobacteriaceae bacterium]|nr:DinB family protein [Cyclobacteriaceae bacterium]